MQIKNDKNNLPLTAIVLAGGRSSRINLDQEKADIKLNGSSLIERVISKVKFVVDKNIIIVSPSKRYSYLSKVVQDIVPQKGPLAGIYSGLKASSTFYNLIVGCDMPFLETKLLWYMRENINSEDVIIPRYNKIYIEPLLAIYSKNCLAAIENNLKKDILPIRLIFPYLKIKYIEDNEIVKFDPEYLSFFNINFMDDLAVAEKLIKNIEGNK